MNHHPTIGLAWRVAVALLFASLLPSNAADLPPSGTNRIDGFVRFTNADSEIRERLGPPGNEGMSDLVIFAYTEAPQALTSTKYFSNTDPLSEPYSLTIAANDVPLTYQVYAALSLDSQTEEYWTSPRPSSPLMSNSPPATVDLDECVALLEIRYVDAAGTPVAALGGRALVVETGPPYSWRARYLSQPPGRTSNFLVVPSGVELEVAVEVDLGTDLYLDRITYSERHVVTYACDEKPVLTMTLPDTGALGKLVGNVNMVGEIELPTDGYEELLGRPVVKGAGPSGNQRYASLSAEYPGPDSTRAFSLENLVPSAVGKNWNLWTEMHLGQGYRFESFRSPGLGEGESNAGAVVDPGATTDIGDAFVMTPAWLTGTITLTGPPELPGIQSGLRGLVRSSDYDADTDNIPDAVGATGINGSYVVVKGVDELARGSTYTTAGGQAAASFEGAFNPLTSTFEGDYEAIVGMIYDQPGIWAMEGINLRIAHPGTNGAPFVEQLLYITEADPWRGLLTPGDRQVNPLNYNLAEVCLRIQSPVKFYYPRVINSYGGITNLDSHNVFRSYQAILSNASGQPYYASEATNEAVITFYVPEGSYTLQPAITTVDPDGNVSEVALPHLAISVIAGERYCLVDCLTLAITPPMCTTNFGFLASAEAQSCDGTLTNLSLTATSLKDPTVRLGYSDIRILVGSRTNLQTANGLFPEFDGFDKSLYEDILYTAVAMDANGRTATRQIVAHYDFTAPTIVCPADIDVTSPDGAGVVVNFETTATDDRPEPVLIRCDPPSGSVFPLGTTLVTCYASDLCQNTNTCSFQVTVSPPGGETCLLRIESVDGSPTQLQITWDCTGVLQSSLSVDGPWTDVIDSVSPHLVDATEPERYYRVVAPTP
ncbi:MAG: HYR domain-containing protein [Verrucomicrobiales bacterium]|nr:HYR domain-containing protein [Verrucomicrobiales bacterium]